MYLVYRISLWIYQSLIVVMSLFNQRAKRFRNERQNLFQRLSKDFSDRQKPCIWVHAASLGEFEQGLPVMEQITSEFPNYDLLVTFYSPSGYQYRKDHPVPDYVHYLPLDSPSNARKFLDIVQPVLAIFVKYEFWVGYLRELHYRNIPILSISSVFRKNQIFFSPFAGFYRTALQAIDHFFVLDEATKKLLQTIDIDQVTVNGDTRADRVLQIAQSTLRLENIKRFKQSKKLIVAGSIWPSDLACIRSLLQLDCKILIAPHQLDERFIQDILKIEGSIRYTDVTEETAFDACQLMILDTMGQLASAYSYADLAIVGGAFRGTLHNVLEPAAHGVPVLFGEHKANAKFVEAGELIRLSAAFTYSDGSTCQRIVEELLKNDDLRDEAGKAALQYVKSQQGATERIMKMIKTYL